jgi:hypothetical protein
LAEITLEAPLEARQVFCPCVRTSHVFAATPVPEVFTVREIARAAGVSTAEVRAVLDESDFPRSGKFLGWTTRPGGQPAEEPGAPHGRATSLCAVPRNGPRRGMPAAASGAFHGGLLAVMILIGTLGVRTAPTSRRSLPPISFGWCSSPRPDREGAEAAVD